MPLDPEALITPANGAVLVDVSASDQTFDPPLRALSIGTAGTVKCDLGGVTGITLPANALAIGIQHAIQITRIYQTGTTASEMVGWY